MVPSYELFALGRGDMNDAAVGSARSRAGGLNIQDSHWDVLIPRLLEGKVVLFLGAGVNVFTRRPEEQCWEIGHSLPTGSELAQYLATRIRYQGPDAGDLLRVAQYVALVEGSAPLYEELCRLLDADYPATPLHQFIAGLPARIRARGKGPRYPLIVTTNYDDVLERTLREHNEPFDLVWYVADGEQRGKFWHQSADGKTELIEKPNEYRSVSTDQRVVILKIHGHVDRSHSDRDSFVITEDHYIDYLTRTDVSSLLPVMLAKTLNFSHFLFLGYSLRDWNLRVILHRMWGQRKLTYRSWAVQRKPSTLDSKFWAERSVDVLDCDLGRYVTELDARCDAQPNSGAQP